jgi:hypothetical protein
MGRMRWSPAAAATPRKTTQQMVSTTAPLASKRGKALPRNPRRLISLSRSRTSRLPRGPIVPLLMPPRHDPLNEITHPEAKNAPNGRAVSLDLRSPPATIAALTCGLGSCYEFSMAMGRPTPGGGRIVSAPIDRRRFLRGSGTVGVGAALAGSTQRVASASARERRSRMVGDVPAVDARNGRVPGLQGARRAQVLPDTRTDPPRAPRLQLPDPQAAHLAEDVEPLFRAEGRLAAKAVRRFGAGEGCRSPEEGDHGRMRAPTSTISPS